jgi:hypothetical protein
MGDEDQLDLGQLKTMLAQQQYGDQGYGGGLPQTSWNDLPDVDIPTRNSPRPSQSPSPSQTSTSQPGVMSAKSSISPEIIKKAIDLVQLTKDPQTGKPTMTFDMAVAKASQDFGPQANAPTAQVSPENVPGLNQYDQQEADLAAKRKAEEAQKKLDESLRMTVPGTIQDLQDASHMSYIQASDNYAKVLEDRLKYYMLNAKAMNGADLTPLLQFTDKWAGHDAAKYYKPPESPKETMAQLQELKERIAKMKLDTSKEMEILNLRRQRLAQTGQRNQEAQIQSVIDKELNPLISNIVSKNSFAAGSEELRKKNEQNYNSIVANPNVRAGNGLLGFSDIKTNAASSVVALVRQGHPLTEAVNSVAKKLLEMYPPSSNKSPDELMRIKQALKQQAVGH